MIGTQLPWLLYPPSFLGSYVTRTTTFLSDSSPFPSSQQETPKSQMFLTVKFTSEQIKFSYGWFETLVFELGAIVNHFLKPIHTKWRQKFTKEFRVVLKTGNLGIPDGNQLAHMLVGISNAKNWMKRVESIWEWPNGRLQRSEKLQMPSKSCKRPSSKSVLWKRTAL